MSIIESIIKSRKDEVAKIRALITELESLKFSFLKISCLYYAIGVLETTIDDLQDEFL